MENKKVCELIELVKLLNEKGLDATKIANGLIDELIENKKNPLAI